MDERLVDLFSLVVANGVQIERHYSEQYCQLLQCDDSYNNGRWNLQEFEDPDWKIKIFRLTGKMDGIGMADY